MDKFEIAQDKGNFVHYNFNEPLQVDELKPDPREIDIFTKLDIHCSSGETEFVDHKHAIDNDQEQNEEKFDVKKPNPEGSKLSENVLTTESKMQIKNEGDIDIFYENIKTETDEGKCEICEGYYQNFGGETDIFESTSYKLECICQKQNEPIFYNIHGEDTIRDVKRTTFGPTPVSGLQVKDETISGDEVTKEQESAAVPRRHSVLPMENNKMKRKLCSKTLENDFSVEHQMNDMTECKINTGDKAFHCQICFKSYRDESDLRVHERTHTREKPFHCQICSKSFGAKGALKVHERIHTGEKPCHCKICSKSFRQKSDLTRHERSHEKIHIGEKPFHCQICSKSFSEKRGLRFHERAHTGEKPFHCQICSTSFNRMENLKMHERRFHTSERPFHCKICSRSFTQMDYLKRHDRRFHAGERLYHCKICSKFFTRMDHLKRHDRRFHTGD